MLNDHPERHGAAHLAVSWTDSKAREAGGTEAVGPGRRLGSAFSRSVARRLPSAECEVSASLSTASSAVSHLPRGSPAAPDVPHSAPKVTIRERARPVTPPRRHAGEMSMPAVLSRHAAVERAATCCGGIMTGAPPTSIFRAGRSTARGHHVTADLARFSRGAVARFSKPAVRRPPIGPLSYSGEQCRLVGSPPTRRGGLQRRAASAGRQRSSGGQRTASRELSALARLSAGRESVPAVLSGQ